MRLHNELWLCQHRNRGEAQKKSPAVVVGPLPATPFVVWGERYALWERMATATATLKTRNTATSTGVDMMVS